LGGRVDDGNVDILYFANVSDNSSAEAYTNNGCTSAVLHC
jgi:hypothetical protein